MSAVLFSEEAQLAVLNVDLYEKVGGKDEALIIQTIHYRCVKGLSTVTYEGEPWARIPSTDLQKVLDKSRTSTWRMVSMLEKQGYIFSKCLGRRKSDKTKHYRVNYDVVKFAESRSKKRRKKDRAMFQNETLQCFNLEHSNVSTWNNHIKTVVKGNGKDTMKADEILKHYKSPIGKKKVKNGNDMGILWSETKAELYDLEYMQVPISNEKKAILKRIKRESGVNMSKFIPWIMKNWIEFGERVKDEMGTYKAPSRPVIKYLAAHANIALDMYRNRGKTKQTDDSNKFNTRF